jgi:aspartate racemase
MKIIGLIGGMSWQSSAEYYRIINEEVRTRLGGQHSARILMYSVDFQKVEDLQHRGQWDEALEHLADAASRIEKGGADLLLICTNTMHKLAPQLECLVRIPLLHIADATAEEVRAQGLSKVGLLGTRFTMVQDFYKARLARHGLDTIVPEEDDREAVHRIIYEELCGGKVLARSREAVVRIIEGLKGAGAEGVILGCTELPLLIRSGDATLPTFDTTAIHAYKAVSAALDS